MQWKRPFGRKKKDMKFIGMDFIVSNKEVQNALLCIEDEFYLNLWIYIFMKIKSWRILI